MTRLATIAVLVLLAFPPAARGQGWVPFMFGYQGVLTDAAGNLVPDGNYPLTFRIFDVPSGGSPLYVENESVQVSKGGFSTRLGDDLFVGLNLPFDQPYWLEIQVAPDATPLGPRVELLAAPYAFMARSVVNNAIDGSKIQDNTVSSADITNGSVGSDDVANGAIGSDDIADGAIISSDVAQGTLSALNLGDEPGVVLGEAGPSAALTPAPTNLIGQTINLPGPGYVLALGSLTIIIDHTSGTASQAYVSVSVASASHDNTNIRRVLLSSAMQQVGIGQYQFPVSVQDVFHFTAAGPRQIWLVGSAAAGLGVRTFGSSLTLVYLPTAYENVAEPNLVAAPTLGDRTVQR